MLIIDSQDLQRDLDATPKPSSKLAYPVPLARDDADVEINTPFGAYCLTSYALARASEFFEKSMSDVWNQDREESSSEQESDDDDVKFRYWLPHDSAIVERNRVTYHPASKKKGSELFYHAKSLDMLFRCIYNEPIELDIAACNQLIEVADAYNSLSVVAPTVSEFWSQLSVSQISDAIRNDPWMFLLSSFEVRDRRVFDSALAHCVGSWHLLPARDRKLLDNPAAECAVDDVVLMRYLPDALQQFVLTCHDSVRATQKLVDTGLSSIAAQPELDALSRLDMELDSGWESYTAYAQRVASEVVRSFIDDNLRRSKADPRSAYINLHRGLQLKADKFFATVDFAMKDHLAELDSVSPHYCRALQEMAEKYRDPDLLLQIHRFHKAIADFQAEITTLVAPLAEDRTEWEYGLQWDNEDDKDQWLLCGAVAEGKYPWRKDVRTGREKKRARNSEQQVRKAMKCGSTDTGFIRGHGACG